MKTLIIGGSGFVGPYLCNHLINDLKWDVDVTKTENEELEIAGARVLNCDILDMDSLKSVFEASKPDYVIHLAAQSSVAVSWKKPQLTANVNIIGCINLLETIKELDKKPRVLLVGSERNMAISVRMHVLLRRIQSLDQAISMLLQSHVRTCLEESIQMHTV